MKNLILDLDGTLVRLQADWGLIRITIEAKLAACGLPIEGSLDQKLLRLKTERSDEFQKFMPELSALECRNLDQAIVNHSLIRRALALNKTQRAIFSMNCRATIDKFFELPQAKAFRVQAIVTKEDLNHPKPDAQGIRLVIERAGWRAEDCVMIGDSDKDRGSAAAAGVDFEWVQWD